jgi:hypothetical protein
MITGAFIGLQLGNRASSFFKDAASLNALIVCCIFYAAVLLETAGFGDDVQRAGSIGVSGVAVLAALVGASRAACCRPRSQ